MTLKKQKIIMFIPVVNFIIPFVWYGFVRKTSTPVIRGLKVLLKVLLIVLLITGVIMLLNSIIHIPNRIMDTIFNYFIAYVDSLVMDFIMIKDQEHA